MDFMIYQLPTEHDNAFRKVSKSEHHTVLGIRRNVLADHSLPLGMRLMTRRRGHSSSARSRRSDGIEARPVCE